MRGPKPAALELNQREREELETLVRKHSTPQQIALFFWVNSKRIVAPGTYAEITLTTLARLLQYPQTDRRPWNIFSLVCGPFLERLAVSSNGSSPLEHIIQLMIRLQCAYLQYPQTDRRPWNLNLFTAAQNFLATCSILKRIVAPGTLVQLWKWRMDSRSCSILKRIVAPGT